MLSGIHPLLTGVLLMHLDHMGHSDAVVVADAHFPAHRLGARVIDLPGTTATEVVAALRTVLPLDAAPAVDLMRTHDGEVTEVQHELLGAAGVEEDGARFIERFAYYDLAETSYLIVRTGEVRKYANVLLRKGLVGAELPPATG